MKVPTFHVILHSAHVMKRRVQPCPPRSETRGSTSQNGVLYAMQTEWIHLRRLEYSAAANVSALRIHCILKVARSEPSVDCGWLSYNSYVFLAYIRVLILLGDSITHSATTWYTSTTLSFLHTYTTTTMICSAPFAFIILFAQAALALPQAGSASTPPVSNTTSSYSSTGTNNHSSTASPYSTTGSTPPYTSSPYPSNSPYPSSSSCPCNSTPSYPPTSKNGTSYSSSGSSGSYTTSSSCSCSSSTPCSSQPTYTSSASYYPPTETNPPPSYSSKGPKPPKTTPPTSSPTFRATFDTFYDNNSGSMNNVACSNGANGLSARFPTFGDVPSFPFIGGAFDVVWNSPNCGSCWTLTNAVTGTSINFVAVDATGGGFNIAQEAFVQLNGGQIGQGTVEVTATKVAPSVCGL
jgi:hypothetical protein